MSIYIKYRVKLKQWLWFISLWLGSLFFTLAITYPLKWLIMR